MRTAIVIGCSVALAGCGDKFNGTGTPEQVIAGPVDGQHVEVTGDVHTVSFDSIQNLPRRMLLAAHSNQVEWVIEQDDEEIRGKHPAYDDIGAQYPRTPDHYILIRGTKPP